MRAYLTHCSEKSFAGPSRSNECPAPISLPHRNHRRRGSRTADNGSYWVEHRIGQIGAASWNPKRAWTRAARGVAILEQLGTPDAVKVLEQLADGHTDAFPTKAAKESLERLKKK